MFLLFPYGLQGLGALLWPKLICSSLKPVKGERENVVLTFSFNKESLDFDFFAFTCPSNSKSVILLWWPLKMSSFFAGWPLDHCPVGRAHGKWVSVSGFDTFQHVAVTAGTWSQTDPPRKAPDLWQELPGWIWSMGLKQYLLHVLSSWVLSRLLNTQALLQSNLWKQKEAELKIHLLHCSAQGVVCIWDGRAWSDSWVVPDNLWLKRPRY